MTKDILWTAEEAAVAADGTLCAKGGPEDAWAATGVSIDSREIEKGDLFVALKDARDGHEFVASAFEKGAAAALVSHVPENLPEGAPVLIVPDTLDGLARLGVAARTRAAKRIAVTGSVGKTSTKEMLRVAFAASGPTHASVKSFNNHWGVPLTLSRVPKAAAYGVFEIGMNHANEITPLTRMVAPDIAIITTIGTAHLENFDNVEGIAEAKAEIFFGLDKGGIAILNKDNPYFDLLAKRAMERNAKQIVSFGEAAGADIQLQAYTVLDGAGDLVVDMFGKRKEFRLAAAGQHQAMNALAVLGAVSLAGASVDKAIDALGALQPVEGRGVRHAVPVAGGEITLIDESYNANPTSVAAAVATLANVAPARDGRRVAVLGDMLELGPEGPAMHAGLADDLIAAGVDAVHTAGPLMEHLHKTLPPSLRGRHAGASKDLASDVVADLRAGDVVMVKGSLGSKMKLIVEAVAAMGEGQRKSA